MSGIEEVFGRMPVYPDKKRQGRFYIEFQLKGERYKERLPGGTTKKDAEKLEIKIKSQMLFEAHGIHQSRPDEVFENFIRKTYLPYVEANHSKVSFEKAIVVCKAALQLGFKGRPMRSFKPADIERFKIARMSLNTLHSTPRKPATVARELSVISKVFSMAVANDICDYNPCSRVEKPKFDNIQDKILQRDDEPAFFNNMHSDWAKDVCKFVLNTGLRQNDVMNLDKFQVDRNTRTAALTQGKTKRRVVIMLNDAAMEIIERRWRNGSRLLFPSPKSGDEKGSVRHAMMRACNRAKIPAITIRDLRRTFATRLEENDIDTLTVAKMLGHSDLRSIHRYRRSFEKMREAAETLTNPAKDTPARLKRVK